MPNMINLNDFAGGALAEKFNQELQNIIDNIYDPNTDAKNTRKMTLTISFKPNYQRTGAAVNIQAKAALASVMPTETNIIIDRDMKTGKVLAAEIGNQIAGQLQMEVDIEESDIDGSQVIDLKKFNNK